MGYPKNRVCKGCGCSVKESDFKPNKRPYTCCPDWRNSDQAYNQAISEMTAELKKRASVKEIHNIVRLSTCGSYCANNGWTLELAQSIHDHITEGLEGEK